MEQGSLTRFIGFIEPQKSPIRVPGMGVDPNYRAINCGYAEADQATLDAGVYNDDTGLFLKYLGGLAISAPYDPSDSIPGTTNYQAALLFGADPEVLNGQFWHFVGGVFDENGLPTQLRFTKDRLWLDLLQNIPPHFPMKGDLDGDVMFCGKTPVPFVQHSGQIEVPILLVGAQGGFGKTTNRGAPVLLRGSFDRGV